MHLLYQNIGHIEALSVPCSGKIWISGMNAVHLLHENWSIMHTIRYDCMRQGHALEYLPFSDWEIRFENKSELSSSKINRDRFFKSIVPLLEMMQWKNTLRGVFLITKWPFFLHYFIDYCFLILTICWLSSALTNVMPIILYSILF